MINILKNQPEVKSDSFRLMKEENLFQFEKEMHLYVSHSNEVLTKTTDKQQSLMTSNGHSINQSSVSKAENKSNSDSKKKVKIRIRNSNFLIHQTIIQFLALIRTKY